MRARQEFERKTRRLESLLQAIGGLEDERARRSALDAVQALLEVHRDVLLRVLELAGPEVTSALAHDDLVSGLLLLHGIHPLPLAERVALVLEKVRPYMGSHGGGVEVLEVGEEVVRLQLEGSCHGCPSSTATMRNAIQQALAESAPDVARIEVEGVVEPPRQAGFVPIGAIGRPEPRSSWHVVEGVGELPPGGMLARDVEGVRIAFCRLGDQPYAYLDRCPACAASMDGLGPDGAALTCSGCGRRYDARRAGRCLDEPALQLEPVPLLAGDGGVRIAVPERGAGVGA
jgi:Fe-S cluster biogenesis protein NfuA/nitrite reductase/ring-hydroxylating ferredoxin subunit